MILLFCFKKSAYAQLAYNMAFSLKHFNPEIEITIYHDGVLNSSLSEEERSYFDKVIFDNTLHIETFKTRLYELSPYKETLYLDVDGTALKSIQPLISELQKKDFYVRNWANHKLSEGNDMKRMRWAFANDLWEHFKLSEEASVPATQTSLIWFKKTEQTKQIFDAWQQAVKTPFPLDKLRDRWGGAQPDEMYLNVALANVNYQPDPNEAYMFFGDYYDNRTFQQLTNDFYFLSVYGSTQTIKRYRKLYDQRIREFHKADGMVSMYQYDRIMKEKHVNNNRPGNRIRKPVVRRSQPNQMKVVDRLLPLAKLKLIPENPTGEINFTLIHPSRGRAQKAYNTFCKWMNNSKNPEKIQYIFSLDSDDKELTRYQKLLPEKKDRYITTVNHNKNLVEAIQKVTDIPKGIEGKILIVVSDDFECPLNWDESLLKVSEGKEEFAIRVADGYVPNDAAIMTLPIVSKSLFLKLGYIYYPGYTGMFADNDLYEASDKLGAVIKATELLFQHNHWTTGKAKRDETYNRHNTNKSWGTGENILKERRKRNFDLIT